MLDKMKVLGRLVGLEPTTSRATILRSNQLSYSRHMAKQPPFAFTLTRGNLQATTNKLENVPPAGLEPAALCLEGRCSIH